MKVWQQNTISALDHLGWDTIITGASPQAKLSIALLSSSTEGSVSSSSITGRHLMASKAEIETLLPLEKRSEKSVPISASALLRLKWFLL